MANMKYANVEIELPQILLYIVFLGYIDRHPINLDRHFLTDSSKKQCYLILCGC